MITRTAAGWQTEDWQIQLSSTISSVEMLFERLNLPLDALPQRLQAAKNFPLRVPEAFVAKMKPGDPDDPLLLQVLPKGAEMLVQPGFVADPLAERAANQQQGMLHKYKNRVLVILSGSCAINCRYCFRRHFDYADNRLSSHDFEAIFAYLASNPDINEVILSGGDPLVVSNSRLQNLVTGLESIAHIKRLRIHTRMPVVIPERVDQGLLACLEQTRLQIILVVHSNHAQELDSVFGKAMQLLKAAGVTLLNQSVLLKGVNDNLSALVNLSEALFDSGVQPYYLHLLDPVAGAAHFDVSEAEAVALMNSLIAEVSGYMVPKLVREVAGELSKTPISLS